MGIAYNIDRLIIRAKKTTIWACVIELTKWHKSGSDKKTSVTLSSTDCSIRAVDQSLIRNIIKFHSCSGCKFLEMELSEFLGTEPYEHTKEWLTENSHLNIRVLREEQSETTNLLMLAQIEAVPWIDD